MQPGERSVDSGAAADVSARRAVSDDQDEKAVFDDAGILESALYS
jgi:hypothetical protein